MGRKGRKGQTMKKLILLAATAALFLAHAGDEIVLPPDANAVERTAAQELAEHWKKATGSEPAVLTNATGKARCSPPQKGWATAHGR